MYAIQQFDYLAGKINRNPKYLHIFRLIFGGNDNHGNSYFIFVTNCTTIQLWISSNKCSCSIVDIYTVAITNLRYLVLNFLDQ